RTTNSVERLNREIRRRDKVIGVYPNVASAERLIGAILIDLNDAWQANARPFLVNFTKRK
ncbi:transposase, partial [Abiotrophia defectiva]